MMRQRSAAEYGTFASSDNNNSNNNSTASNNIQQRTASTGLGSTLANMSFAYPSNMNNHTRNNHQMNNNNIQRQRDAETTQRDAMDSESASPRQQQQQQQPQQQHGQDTADHHDDDNDDDDDDSETEEHDDNDNDNTNNTDNNNNNNTNDHDDDDDDEDDDEFYRGGLAQMTRQLRCLFSTITWPIIPLGAVVSFSLIWVLYAAFLLDIRRNCSHPLHWYALASLLLVTYTPFHAQARSYLFHYSRERDGPVRPAGVRMYDQLFHTICLLYVYGGVTLIQTCKEDVATTQLAGVVNKDAIAENPPVSLDPSFNSCAATCPHLYHSLVFYITTLELFTFSLILPLLFLPCIYVWFLRRATSDYETLAHFRERLEEEEALLSNGGITAEEILQSLEDVKLVFNPTKPGVEVWILPKYATDFSGGKDGSEIKECCICMNDFHVQDDINIPPSHHHQQQHDHDDYHDLDVDDLESGLGHGPSAIASSSSPQDDMVRTKCGHVFHRKCLAGWIGGRWEGNPHHAVAEMDPATTTTADNETAASTATTPTTSTAVTTTRRHRKARRTCCPLCRYDLRSSIGTPAPL